MNLIDVKDLNFEYPGKQILKNVSFSIPEGSITAMVGPNGAGKTTLLRCLTGLEAPLSGTVTINGVDVHDDPRAAHQYMGYLSDFFGLYEDLTVRQCLTYMAWCHKIPGGDVAAKVDRIAEEVFITKYLNEKAGTLSRGYRQRLGVGLTLMHDPKLLMLDEPASGMDPEARIKLSELMIALKRKGMTIIVSSHILAELEDYCTDMLVIRDGEIKSHILLKEHQKQAETIVHLVTGELDDAQKTLITGFEGVSALTANPEGGYDCTINGDQERQAALLVHLIRNSVTVYEFTPIKKTLKAAYMDLAAEEGTKS